MIRWLLSILCSIRDALRPPRSDENGRKLYRWRQSIYTAIVICFFALVGHGAWAHWYPGFARAASVQDVNNRIATVQAQLIEERILRMRERQCDAIQANNEAAKRFAARRMTRLQRLYRRHFGYTYDMPPCEAL